MSHKIIASLTMVFLLAGLVVPAMAQTFPERMNDVPVLVATDKKLYQYGSDIVVTGSVANKKMGIPITITVFNPQGNVVGAQQIDVSDDRTFNTIIKASGSLWNKEGMYKIRVQYGAQEVHDRTVIELVGSPTAPVGCGPSEITVKSGTNSYCVTYEITGATVKAATVGTEQSSIHLSLDSKADGHLLLVIPRSILDSKSGAGDSPFVVMADGEPIDAYESYSDRNSRTLEIEIPEFTKDLEIVGTWAVPEFGTIAAMILLVAIASIVAVSARSRLALFTRY